MSGFLAMGGYGAYVWPCFALGAVVLVWNVITARRLLAGAKRGVLRRRSEGRGA